MYRTLTAALAALTLAAPAGAAPFRAENRVSVTAAPGGFLVHGGGGQGARGMWCAAADYAREVLGAPQTQRVYVAQDSPRGLGLRQPVLFTLDPSGLTPSRFLIVGGSVGRAGANLLIGHAYSFCADHRLPRY